MKKIGMRNLKTSMAVFLCIIIIKLFNMDSPFYACIAAVICMQSSVFDSFTAGKNRMIGTFIGALMGLIFATIKEGNPFLVALGIIIVIYTCHLLGKNKSITIACIVFIAIMVNLTDKTPLIYSTSRLLETFIGIIVSVLVNYFLFPPKYLEILYHMKLNILNILDTLCQNKLNDSKDIDLDTLKKQISNYQNLLKSYSLEITGKKLDSTEIKDLNNSLDLFTEAYEHLNVINSIKCPVCFKDMNTENINNIIYTYHMKNLLNIIDTLKGNL